MFRQILRGADSGPARMHVRCSRLVYLDWPFSTTGSSFPFIQFNSVMIMIMMNEWNEWVPSFRLQESSWAKAKAVALAINNNDNENHVSLLYYSGWLAIHVRINQNKIKNIKKTRSTCSVFLHILSQSATGETGFLPFNFLRTVIIPNFISNMTNLKSHMCYSVIYQILFGSFSCYQSASGARLF